MSDIIFTRRHTLAPAKARALAQKITDDLAAEHHLNREWHGNTMHFERTGVHGLMHVGESQVRLEVNLGFLFKPLKTVLAGHIEREFDKYLPEPKKAARKAS